MFYKSEKNAIDPLIPLKLFKNRFFSIQILTALLLSSIQIGFQTYFPIWLQSIYRTTAFIAGLLVSPSPILWLISSFFVGFLVKRFAPKYISIPLILLMTMAYSSLIFTNENTSLITFFIVSGITGAVLGIIITMSTLVAQRVVPEENLATASAMITLGRTLGQTLAAGVFGPAFNIATNEGIQRHTGISKRLIKDSIQGKVQAKIGVNNQTVNGIILSGMHIVFGVTLVIFLILLLTNKLDTNTKSVK